MVERPLSMQEVPGSIPGFSTRRLFIFLNHNLQFKIVILPFLSSHNFLIEEENTVRRNIFNSIIKDNLGEMLKILRNSALFFYYI